MKVHLVIETCFNVLVLLLTSILQGVFLGRPKYGKAQLRICQQHCADENNKLVSTFTPMPSQPTSRSE